MRDHELPGLLRRAVEDLPEQDLAEQAWVRGRRRRRRRTRAGLLGGTVAAGLLAVAAVQVPGQGGLLHPSGTQGDPAARSAEGMVLQPPPASDPDGATGALEWWDAQARPVPVVPPPDQEAGRDRAQRVWATVWTACLESRGYTVDAVGDALTMTRDGAGPGDYTRDRGLCRAELRTDSPVVLPRSGEITPAERTAVMNRWFEYDWARQCLVGHDLPAGPRPLLAEDFVNDLVWAQLPPWHPYVEAAGQGMYELAREACPLG